MRERERLVAGSLDGYEPEIGAALWRLQDARERTERVLANVTDDLVNAEVDGNSVGTILYHVALIEADWLYAEILERDLPPELSERFPHADRDAEGVLVSVSDETLADHRARLAAVRDAVLDALRSMGAEEFHRARSLPDYDVDPAWVLHHLAQHEAEHRSELDAIVRRLRPG